MYSPTPSVPGAPPPPPPKPSSHDASRLGTPAAAPSPRPPPVPDYGPEASEGQYSATDPAGLIPATAYEEQPDPGEEWLPAFVEDKSKQDLTNLLSDPKLLHALTHAPGTAHPSLAASHAALQAALAENLALAGHLEALEARLADQRAVTQAQLLATHALERQWRQKQADMDAALAPFAPAALYARLTQALAEQAHVCAALEESFLDGGGGGGGASGPGPGGADEDDAPASERETADWLRRYREAKKLYYLRHERKERWNERRVGGWR